MSDDLTDTDTVAVDVSGLCGPDVQALGDSVLGHAVRRAHAAEGGGGVSAAGGPIAAFQDSL